MRFGDRVSATSQKVLQRRQKQYWEFLHRNGFKRNHLLYRYFAADIFHDGEIEIEGFCLARAELRMVFLNVYALDQVVQANLSLSPRRRPRIERRHFRTPVVFCGVHHIKVHDNTESGQKHYYSAEISRDRRMYDVEIQFTSLKGYGTIRFSCHKLRVEDIGPSIAKYIPDGIDPEVVVSCVNANPRQMMRKDWGGTEKGEKRGRI